MTAMIELPDSSEDDDAGVAIGHLLIGTQGDPPLPRGAVVVINDGTLMIASLTIKEIKDAAKQIEEMEMAARGGRNNHHH